MNLRLSERLDHLGEWMDRHHTIVWVVWVVAQLMFFAVLGMILLLEYQLIQQLSSGVLSQVLWIQVKPTPLGYSSIVIFVYILIMGYMAVNMTSHRFRKYKVMIFGDKPE